MADRGFPSSDLEEWYRKNKRKFPWRDTGDPYDVWVSEIMLQQTRIPVVLNRFPLFRKQFPDVFSLARCSEDSLLKAWEGMGYYSRARNMRKCAAVLVREYGGILPKDPEELKKLPGIGPYTAGAIASIAYGIPCPAVDGNVIRVWTRWFALSQDAKDPKLKRKIEKEMSSIMKERGTSPADFTQGLMELGEVVCTAGAPRCAGCPLRDSCRAHAAGKEGEYPALGEKKERRTEEKTVLVLQAGDEVVVHKREEGLLGGLYEFPMMEGARTEEEVRGYLQERGFCADGIRRLPDSVHVFTHRIWRMRGYAAWGAMERDVPGWIRVKRENLDKYAFPSALKAYRNIRC